MISNDDRSFATAYDQAYRYLRDSIRDGILAGGTRVKPEEIAVKLGLSRMPVREAIRQLDSEGLLTIRPNRGAIVTVLTPDDILELFEMRAALEGVAIRRAIELFDEDDFDELTLLLNRMNRAQSDVNQWIERHSEFHDYICRRSGRQRLFTEVQRLRIAVEPYLRIGLLQSHDPDTAAREHQEIHDVLRAGDPDRAEVQMREHILTTAHELIALLPPSQAEAIRGRRTT